MGVGGGEVHTGGLDRDNKFHAHDQNSLAKRGTLVVVGTGEFRSLGKAGSVSTKHRWHCAG